MKDLEAKLEGTCEKLRYLFTVLKADVRVTQLDKWLVKLYDEALEVKSAVARYLDNRSSSRNSSVASSKKSTTVKSNISKSMDKQQSDNLFNMIIMQYDKTTKHEMPQFEMPTMKPALSAHHKNEANLNTNSKCLIHGQQLCHEEQSKKVITDIVIWLTGLNHNKIFVNDKQKVTNKFELGRCRE